jgi:hypothetical protein
VRVELVVNGEAVDTTEITANGEVSDIKFNYKINKSGWVALRILPSSHSNPVFVTVDNKPVIEEKKRGMVPCDIESMLENEGTEHSRVEEKKAAEEAYEKARNVYRKIIDSQ